MFWLTKRRREVAARVETVDDRRRGREQADDTILRGDERLAELLARSDVAPRADHFQWFAVVVTDQALLVVHPAIGAILAAEAVLDSVDAILKETSDLRLNARQVVGVDAVAPEGRVIEVFARLVAEDALDIVADEGRAEIVARLEAVDYGWRRAQ